MTNSISWFRGGARGHQTPARRHLSRLRLRQVLRHRGAKAGPASALRLQRGPWVTSW